jgi:hypothetical protein
MDVRRAIRACEREGFPLNTYKIWQIPAHFSPDRIPEPDVEKLNSPYFQISDCDIDEMEAEVEDTSSESDGENAPPEAESTAKKRKRSTQKEPEKKLMTVDNRASPGEVL